MNKKLINQGAEAKIFKKKQNNNTIIIKQRINKKYRIESINKLLIPSRTKREVKIINKLKLLGVKVPEVLSSNKKDMIELEFITGKKIRDVIDKNIDLAKEIGFILAKLHDNNIIHGDLTTSNMILKENKIYLIDFGLSFISKKLEDKAVDIHLFKRALESKHHKIFKQAFFLFLEGYAISKQSKYVIQRLKSVESRGRNIGK